MKKGINSIMSLIMALAVTCSVSAVPAMATDGNGVSDENAPGWTERSVDQNRLKVASAKDFEWVLTDSSWYSTDLGSHYMKSYIMTNLNDTRFVRADVEHYDNDGEQELLGYARARFETAFGSVHEGTDSGRIWGYGFSSAQSPNAMEGGIAHTYCGDESTT